VLFLGTTGLLPHAALTWTLLEHEGSEPEEVDLLPFPESTGWDPRYRSGYPREIRPEYGVVLRQALVGGRYGSVVTLELGERSPFLPDWLAKWDAWGQSYVRLMPEQRAYSLKAEKAFPKSDARIRLYLRAETGPAVLEPAL
jgi:hypothetical protein